jgi:hypothetical protein
MYQAALPGPARPPADTAPAMTHRLTYVSRAGDLQHLREILETSRVRNAEAGITGALCLLDGVYMQCLEGKLPALQDAYRRIARDSRHGDLRLLKLEAVQRRYFEHWSLALLTWTDETRAMYEFFMPEGEHDLYDIDADKASTLLRTLSQSKNWLAA